MVATAAYLRVSTEKQDWKLQRTAIQRAVTARGQSIPKRLWFEEKRSGSSIDRPELKKLRAAVRAGVVGRVYVFALDRLTRSGIRDTIALIEEFRHHGCELIALMEGFDFNGPAGEIMAAAMAWCAQMELRRIRERIQAARVRVEASGGRWGRPRRIDPATLERARGMKSRNNTLREIAQALKVPRSTLSDALRGRGHYAEKTKTRTVSNGKRGTARAAKAAKRTSPKRKTRAQRA